MSTRTITINDTFDVWFTQFNFLAGDVGDMTLLDIVAGSGTEPSSLVAATNTLHGRIGTISSLTTTSKTDLVTSINELVTNLGFAANLTTTDKTNVVAGVNELDSRVGELVSLTTSDKTSIVAAVNELQTEIDVVASAAVLTLNTITGGPLAESKGGTGTNSIGDVLAGSNRVSLNGTSGGTVTDKVVGSNLTIDVNMTNIASDLAGDGLSATAGVMKVNVDNSTIETNSDTLRVKSGGITSSHLSSSVTSGILSAYVEFNGTSTVSIYKQKNISGITDNGVGDYTITFTTPFSDANYIWTTGMSVQFCHLYANSRSSKTAANIRIQTEGYGGSNVDVDGVCLMFIGS